MWRLVVDLAKDRSLPEELRNRLPWMACHSDGWSFQKECETLASGMDHPDSDVRLFAAWALPTRVFSEPVPFDFIAVLEAGPEAMTAEVQKQRQRWQAR